MAKPRTRLFNIRLTEEEFLSIQRASNKSGAASVSEFCRKVVFQSDLASGEQSLREIERRLGQLEEMTTQLTEQLSTFFLFNAL